MPIMRKAVRVESKRKAILFVGAAGMLRLLTLPVSATETQKKDTNITRAITLCRNCLAVSLIN